jgi:hypothetical protein
MSACDRPRDAKGRFIRKGEPPEPSFSLSSASASEYVLPDWRDVYREKVIKLTDARWIISASRHARAEVRAARAGEALEIAKKQAAQASARADKSGREFSEMLLPYMLKLLRPEIAKIVSEHKGTGSR